MYRPVFPPHVGEEQTRLANMSVGRFRWKTLNLYVKCEASLA